MVAMMLWGPFRERIQPVWQQRLRGFGVNEREKGDIIEFFGQRTEAGHNQVVETFY